MLAIFILTQTAFMVLEQAKFRGAWLGDSRSHAGATFLVYPLRSFHGSNRFCETNKDYW